MKNNPLNLPIYVCRKKLQTKWIYEARKGAVEKLRVPPAWVREAEKDDSGSTDRTEKVRLSGQKKSTQEAAPLLHASCVLYLCMESQRMGNQVLSVKVMWL